MGCITARVLGGKPLLWCSRRDAVVSAAGACSYPGSPREQDCGDDGAACLLSGHGGPAHEDGACDEERGWVGGREGGREGDERGPDSDLCEEIQSCLLLPF